MTALPANSVFHALQRVARTVQPTRIDIARTVRDFADQDATKIDAIGRFASAVSAACYGGSGGAYSDDFRVVLEFIGYVEGEFALADFTVPDTAVDQQHSRDESHFLDQEKR